MNKKQSCKKCRYTWTSRKEKPRQCPNCKRQIKYKVLSILALFLFSASICSAQLPPSVVLEISPKRITVENAPGGQMEPKQEVVNPQLKALSIVLGQQSKLQTQINHMRWYLIVEGIFTFLVFGYVLLRRKYY